MSELQEVALWMMGHGYATGHGDTIADMLDELEAQIKENAKRAPCDDAEFGMKP